MKEIREAGGKAISNYDNVENGDRIVQRAVTEFGRVGQFLLKDNFADSEKFPFSAFFHPWSPVLLSFIAAVTILGKKHALDS